MKRSMGLLVAAMLVAGLLGAAAPAFAGDDDIRRSGGCSSNSEWKLKLSEEDGGIEVEYEVDQNVNGDKWRVKLFRDGKRFFRGTRTTKGPSGSFEVRRVTNNGSGPDHFRAKARNLSTDEVCRGKATW
ncbi:MAG TPA: hypothetical protein VE889_08195 [Actinomycetota bacterium]|nr:hypothetical protein [Actinomycetota bacterium]